MRKILYKNSASGIIQLVFTSLLTFISITVFIRYLGAELYGLFSIISVIGNINVFTGLGLNTTLIKYIAEQGRIKESHLDIAVTLLIICSMLIILSSLALIFNNYILLNILNIPANYLDVSRNLYYFLILSNFFTFLGQTFSSVIDSQQKIFLTNISQMLYNVLYWGSMIFLLILGYSIDLIGLGILFASLIWFALIVIFFFNTWGKLEFDGLKDNFFRISKKQIGYGLKIYTSGLVGLFYEPLTKILISQFLGIKEVGYFDMILKVRNQFQNLIGKAYYPMYPLIAQTSEFFRLRKIVHDIEQKVFLIMPPVVASVIFCSQPFTELWIGQNSELITIGIIIITASYLMASLTIIPFYLYLMTKKASVTILIQVINVLVNALAFLLTYKFWGFYSVFVASSVAIASSFFVSLYYQKKYLESLIFDSFKQVGQMLIILLLDCVIGYILSIVIHNNIFKLISIPLILFAISVSLYRVLSVFNIDDISRYFGNDSKLFLFCSKILIKN